MRSKKLSRWSILLLMAVVSLPPASAQVDLTGAWGAQFLEDQPERIPGPELLDYLGLPINDFARKWALAWAPDRLGLQEHQCQVHTAAYIYRGPLLLRVWEHSKKTVVFVTHDIDEAIFMGNRVVVMSARPGRIKLSRDVELPHPRHYSVKTTPAFSALKGELTEAVRAEVMAATAT